jgi:hypothetical protein
MQRILVDVAQGCAGQRRVEHYDTITAADALEALSASAAFHEELLARVGLDGCDAVMAILSEAAGASLRGVLP